MDVCVCGGGSCPRSWTYFRCGKPSHETAFRTVSINTIVKRCEKNMGFVYSLSSNMVCRKILPFSSMILPAINPHFVWGHCWAARQWATKSVSVPVNPHAENYESGPGKLKFTCCSIPGLQKRGEKCKWFCIETWIQQDFPMFFSMFSPLKPPGFSHGFTAAPPGSTKRGQSGRSSGTLRFGWGRTRGPATATWAPRPRLWWSPFVSPMGLNMFTKS